MTARVVRWLLFLWLVPCLALAVAVKSDAPSVYVVKKGDTLWDIAGMYLPQPWQWPELWRNNTFIKNPHLIYPGDELHLSFNQQGEPQLSMVREPVKPTIKLTPQGKRISKPAKPIPSVSWSVIAPYVHNDFVVDQQQLDDLPKVLGDADGGTRFASNDLVTTEPLNGNENRYWVVRKVQHLIDSSGKELGWHIRHVADVKVVEPSDNGAAVVKVVDSHYEMQRGDRLMPARATDDNDNLPLVPATNQRGEVVAGLQQHVLMGKYDVVAINLGVADIKVGNVLGIYHSGPQIDSSDKPRYEEEEPWLKSTLSWSKATDQPAIKIGQLIVFKVFEHSSFGLIIRSVKTVKRGAIVAHP